MAGLNALSSKELDYFRQEDSDHWRLSDPYLIDTSNSKKDWFTIYPTNNMEGTTLDQATTDFSFHINEGMNYILPSESYIQLQFSITKNAANDVVAPVNPISHCLFRSSAYYINDSLIEMNKDHNQLRGLVHGLMNYRKSFLDKAGQNLGWALDTPASDNGINKYNITTAQTANSTTTTNNPLGLNTLTGAQAKTDITGGDRQIVAFHTLVTQAAAFDNAADGANAQAPRNNFNAAAAALYHSAQVALPTASDLGNLTSISTDLQTYNDGLIKRYASRTSNGAIDTYNIRIPLSELFSFCKEVKTVFRKFAHRIDFSFNKDMTKILHRNGGADLTAANIEIKKMRLWLCYVHPSTEMHSRQLKKHSDLFRKRIRKDI